MDIIYPLYSILVFPGLLFLSSYAMLASWLDRRFYANMQNRVGPPYFQPMADFIKLLAKEVIIPKAADKKLFQWLPLVAISAVATSALLIPMGGKAAAYSFEGDLVATVYLLTIPTVTFFLAGYSSTSPYATIGSMRVLTQLFAYEVPLFLAVLGPAILSGSWKIAGICAFFAEHPALMLVNIIGFCIAVVALQGKLERVPFDIPHGETEIVGGVFTEYSGRLLGFFLLSIDMEMVVGAALINAVFMGGLFAFSGVLGFLTFVVKTLSVVFVLSAMKALMARIRIEQMVNFCWKILAPLGLLQVLINIIVKARING
ncbi:MAG: NADH-quinone oxidoreductase subunit H [Elusimicrobia bacterium]|nr:NADH-quinone oxidoreductase subunit H [Elusimicrobiota bacterium]